MDLYISAPHFAADPDFRIEEIRSGIAVDQSRVYDLHLTAVDSTHVACRP